MIIKEIDQTEICEAKKLIWKVFLNFEASDYTKEGINTFKNFLDNKEALLKLKMYGAYIDDSLVGVIGTRKNNNHISVFFVYKKYQKQGIGKSLFKIVIQKATKDEVTVNSSPFAVDIYKKLGFECIDHEQLVDGIRFVPMLYRINKKTS